MMKSIFSTLLIFVVAVAFTLAENTVFNQPQHFPDPFVSFDSNALTPDKVALGRLLFFDPMLSLDETISCASCHSPYNAFAHTDHALSHGIRDQIGQRNAPALFNLAWKNTLMWDGAANHIETQALAPLTNEKEMGEDLAHVLSKLQASSFYPQKFLSVFGDSIIQSQSLLKALASFQLSLISANAKYDQVQLGELEFTDQELNGERLFMQHCNACHTAPLFSNDLFKQNGLQLDPTLNDLGRMVVTMDPKDSLKFKVPSLRNLSYSYPYMHDGRFNKLNEVIAHYTSLSRNNLTSNELAQPITLTENDKVDLVAFLLTLNDKDFIFNQKHQFPKELLIK